MALLPWLLVPLVTLSLFAWLIWGLQKTDSPAKIFPSLSDEESGPSADEVASTRRPLGSRAANMRRFLCKTLGPDTPDLTIAYWVCDRFPTIQFTSYHQCFLPLSGQLTDSLDYVEELLFEEAPEQEIPPKSRLQTAWTFIHLPQKNQDLAIQTYFQDRKMEHRLFLMDGEGHLRALAGEFEADGCRLMGDLWFRYREIMVSALAQGPVEKLCEELEELTAFEETRADAHRWLSRVAPRVEGFEAMATRHLAFAQELKPGFLPCRAESAKASTVKTRNFTIDTLNHVRSESEDPALAGYLLAQSLLTLDYSAQVRHFCELLLDQRLTHGGTSRLLREMNRRERGAQT